MQLMCGAYSCPALPKVPTVERFELINAVLEISMYHAPSSVVLPEEYTPPQLAVSKLYWKGWVLLLVLSSFNPCTLGREVWREYPTLRGLMEMVMTRSVEDARICSILLEMTGLFSMGDDWAV